MRKKLDSAMKVLLLAVLVTALCFGVSCREDEEQTPPPAPTPPTTQEQPATPPAAAAAQQPTQVQPVAAPAPKPQEAPKPAEVAAAPAQTAASPAGDLVPVEVELPKPMFVGTPQDIKVDNLEKPLGKPRPPFLAPKGTTNVALNKPVSSSDSMPIIGELEMVTDGDKEAADGSYIELGWKPQHVTIDLEKEHNIHAILVWHYHKQPRVYMDVVAQVSNDKDFITGVTTVFNNDMDNSAGLGVGTDMHYIETNEGRLIDLLSKGSPKGRYVRLYSNGNTSNDLNHYIEVEVYGTPAQ